MFYGVQAERGEGGKGEKWDMGEKEGGKGDGKGRKGI